MSKSTDPSDALTLTLTQNMGAYSVEHQRSVYQVAFWPLILYLGLATYFMFKSKFSFFSFHPFFMTAGFITLAGNAALIKKIGGYENTKTHGILMTIASVCAGIATQHWPQQQPYMYDMLC